MSCLLLSGERTQKFASNRRLPSPRRELLVRPLNRDAEISRASLRLPYDTQVRFRCFPSARRQLLRFLVGYGAGDYGVFARFPVHRRRDLVHCRHLQRVDDAQQLVEVACRDGPLLTMPPPGKCLRGTAYRLTPSGSASTIAPTRPIAMGRT